MSNGVCMHVCEFAKTWQRQSLTRWGAHVARLEKIHNNLSDVVSVTMMIYGRHYSG